MESQLGSLEMVNPRWTYDRKLSQWAAGIVGVDEAGRGCLAGPVVAGCVILPRKFFASSQNRKAVEAMNDSKRLGESEREELAEVIRRLSEQKVVVVATGWATVEEIELHDVVGATCLAMERAMVEASLRSNGEWSVDERGQDDLFSLEKTQKPGWKVLVDGRRMKRLSLAHEGLVKGDARSLAVAMASILAKVSRDRRMRELHEAYPQFDFGSNKGYGTPAHLSALEKHGSAVCHRPRFLRKLSVPSPGNDAKFSRQSRLNLP